MDDAIHVVVTHNRDDFSAMLPPSKLDLVFAAIAVALVVACLVSIFLGRNLRRNKRPVRLRIPGEGEKGIPGRTNGIDPQKDSERYG
jgi:hypothetical protein